MADPIRASRDTLETLRHVAHDVTLQLHNTLHGSRDVTDNDVDLAWELVRQVVTIRHATEMLRTLDEVELMRDELKERLHATAPPDPTEP
jgi:hypothetical protein